MGGGAAELVGLKAFDAVALSASSQGAVESVVPSSAPSRG